MTWALEQAPVDDPTEALLLVALADRAGDDGRGAWPSQQWLAERVRVNDRSIRRLLHSVEGRGIIERGDQRLVEHLPADRRPVVWNLCLNRVRSNSCDRSPTTGRQQPPGRSRPVADSPPVAHDRSLMTERPVTGDRTTGYRQPPNRPEPSRTGDAQKRGHRVSADFAPTADLRTWARNRGFNDAQIGEMTERFIDYWTSTTGRNAVKADWDATWRNWVSKEDPARVRGAVSRLTVVGDQPALTKDQIDDILGPDGWQLPPAPDGLIDGDPAAYRAWARRTADEHRAARVQAALAKLDGTA
jgi:hypothetical protein